MRVYGAHSVFLVLAEPAPTSHPQRAQGVSFVSVAAEDLGVHTQQRGNIGGSYLIRGWKLQLVDIEGRHQGNGVEAILQERLLGALLCEIVPQLHHGCERHEAAACGGRTRWGSGRAAAGVGRGTARRTRTPTRSPRLVSRERWQGRGDRSPSESPGCILMGISRLPSRRAPGSSQRGEGGKATRAQAFRTRPRSRRAGLLRVSRGPQRERCSAARPTPHPHSPHARLRQVWAPSALRGSASPAPACSNGGGGAAAGGSAIGFCASRLRAPPPSCRSRGPRAGVRVGRLRLDAAPPARGSAAQRSTRLQWRGGVPRGPRALPDPGKENLRFQMPNRGIPRRAAQPWGGGRALGG